MTCSCEHKLRFSAYESSVLNIAPLSVALNDIHFGIRRYFGRACWTSTFLLARRPTMPTEAVVKGPCLCDRET